MDEIECIRFLSSYTLGAGAVRIIKNMEDIHEANIPIYWKNALMNSDIEMTKMIILDEWKKYCNREMSNTIAYWKNIK